MTATASTKEQAAPEEQDVTGLDPAQWHDRLKQLAGSAGADPVMARDAVRRCRAGLLAVRDMRLILLATGHAAAWEPARHAVITFLARRPDAARQVLITHTQIEAWPALKFDEPDPSVARSRPHALVAVIGPVDDPVAGPPQQAGTSREAKDRAALALLARLAGAPLPGEEPPSGEDRIELPGMLAEVFEQQLRTTADRGEDPSPELEQEALRRARAGRLRHREIHLLLFTTLGAAWTAVRRAALERAALMPPAPAQLLHWHAEQHGHDHGLTYEEQPAPEGRHAVRALLQAEEAWTGPVRSARSRKTARHYASCALLAQLASLPEPAAQGEDKPADEVRITLPDQGQDPVKFLNKHHQREAISKPEAQLRTLGNRVECTYCCQHKATDTTVRATGVGTDKPAARRAAALKLLRKLAALDAPARSPAPEPVATPRPASPPVPPQPTPAAEQAAGRPPLPVGGRTARALLEEAVTAGCPVTFAPATADSAAAWWFCDSARQPLPMEGLPAPLTAASGPTGTAGWRVPLLEGLTILRQARAEASAPTAFWQRALHLVLQLVRARLIYPALTDDGQALWRVGPIPPAAETALTALAAAAPPRSVPPGTSAREALISCWDAVADALVRTPAAEALFGPTPWTAGSPQPVAAEVLRAVHGWLDDVEDLVDGGPPPLLILRIQPPSDDQAAAGLLTADLHLAPAGAEPDAGSDVPAADVWSAGVRLDGDGAAGLGPRVRRVLRRGARLSPVLAALAGQHRPRSCTLHAGAIEALLDQEAELAETGVRVMWPERLRTALSSAAVIGTDTSRTAHDGPPRGVGERPRFSVTALLDFRWQLALEGAELSEAEMDALAEAARPLVRIRGQWVIADAVLRSRARHRLLGQLPAAEALTAALTGTLTLTDERDIPCRAAGALADLITVLRQGEHHTEPVAVPAGLRAELRGYQQRALTWLAHTTRLGFGAVLADDMGLGKTLTALAFTLHHQQHTQGPTLVACPASLVTTWCREAARFAPGLPVLAYHGTDRTLDAVTDTTLVITTYGVLLRDAERLAERHWALVIADEAQHAKNHTSATARHLRLLPSTTRLALTGTPVENNLSELWALLDWTNPKLFGLLKTFRSRWANAAEKDPESAEAAELGRLIAPFLLRRRKTDPGIAPELPAKIDQPRPVQLTTEQAGLYEALVRETLQQIQAARGIERKGLVFKLLTALKQITNHPAHYLREQPPTAAQSAQFTERSAKTAALVELLQTFRARDEAALIFTSYVTMGRLLTAHLTHLGHDPLFLHGATSLPERQRMIDAFQAGRHPVMILSLKAAGTGLTLTRATHVVHFDRSWNAAVEDQATDRAHRIGQRRTVTVHRLITEHTVEDRIDELLTRKRALASAVLTSGDQALTQLTDRELADLVRLGGNR
ncbi:DEAD/DEAH box helicase [Streptomyces sp. NBC_01601]|uniref:DEAD/DEAH box helicase n=1 Tax=Streptomyces sp. NBC_01601 TaxID=2975892 RepID=UPI002E2B7A56|nr:DEAD/DEAH box helicase [Streptomyces sp. NBC_01601]